MSVVTVSKLESRELSSGEGESSGRSSKPVNAASTPKLIEEARRFVKLYLDRMHFREPRPDEYKYINIAVKKIRAIGAMDDDIDDPVLNYVSDTIDYLTSNRGYRVFTWSSLVTDHLLCDYAYRNGVNLERLNRALDKEKCSGTYEQGHEKCSKCQGRSNCALHQRRLGPLVGSGLKIAEPAPKRS